MVWWAWNLWRVPSSMHRAITPLHSPSSMIRSNAKYSTKNLVSCFMLWPYKVWSMAWPVLSAAQAQR